jgi:hypothetical protein
MRISGDAGTPGLAVAVTPRDLSFRRVEFLFSRDRMNVTISRARCLAYLACPEVLLKTWPGDGAALHDLCLRNAVKVDPASIGCTSRTGFLRVR